MLYSNKRKWTTVSWNSMHEPKNVLYSAKLARHKKVLAILYVYVKF